MTTALAAATVAVAAGGCGGASAPQGAGGHAVADGTFKLALNADPGSLDPHGSQLGAVQQLALFLYDPLVHEARGGRFVSGLADRWSQQGAVARFHVRSGVTCSDGQPLTAATVADNLNYVADPKSASPLIGITIPAGSHATVAPGSDEVTLKLGQPAPFLLQGVANLPIVCAKGMANRAILRRGADGTGPYVLKSVVPGSKYVLARRSGYRWGAAGASTAPVGLPAHVEVAVLTNETTAANLLVGG